MIAKNDFYDNTEKIIFDQKSEKYSILLFKKRPFK